MDDDIAKKYIDFYVVNQAKNVILSNSSFGWWCGWLNDNANLIIAPKYWARHNVSDGYWATGDAYTRGFSYMDREGNLFDYEVKYDTNFIDSKEVEFALGFYSSKNIGINLKKMIHPNAVISLKIGTKNVEDDVASSVWGFFSIYVISFIILLLGLVVTGLDFESSFSAIGACLNNLGPGLGEVSQTYESVSPVGKGILSFAMILGRLEIFTLLVLFTPVFWRG